MINFHTFMLGLLIVSAVTSLTAEAVKKILTERNKTYHANTLVGVIAVVVALAFGIGYGAIAGVGITAASVVALIALMFFGWLCAMVGYDKVIQTLSQFKMEGKDE